MLNYHTETCSDAVFPDEKTKPKRKRPSQLSNDTKPFSSSTVSDPTDLPNSTIPTSSSTASEETTETSTATSVTSETTESEGSTATSSEKSVTTTQSSETLSTTTSTLNSRSSSTEEHSSPRTTLVLRTSSASSAGEDVRIRCPQGSLNEFGTEGRNSSGVCFDAFGCFDIGLHLNKSLRLEVFCVSRDNKRREGGLCCYRDTASDCAQGVASLPVEPCASLDDCNLSNNRTTERWCDLERKKCCRNEFNETRMLCPDGVTALMNEPFCTGFDERNTTSGTCPFANGVCFHGHCCPPHKIRKEVPGTSYQTQHQCTNLTKIPKNHRFGYCDPASGTIWIMGDTNFHGQPTKKLSYYCLNSRDCWQQYETDNVCVVSASWRSQCYANPSIEYYVPKEPNLFLVSTFSYVAVGTTLLSLVFSILYKFWIPTSEANPEHLEPLISGQSYK